MACSAYLFFGKLQNTCTIGNVFYATAASVMRWHIAIDLCVRYIDYIVNFKNLFSKATRPIPVKFGRIAEPQDLELRRFA